MESDWKILWYIWFCLLLPVFVPVFIGIVKPGRIGGFTGYVFVSSVIGYILMILFIFLGESLKNAEDFTKFVRTNIIDTSYWPYFEGFVYILILGLISGWIYDNSERESFAEKQEKERKERTGWHF